MSWPVRILSLIVIFAGTVGGVAWWGYGRGHAAGTAEIEALWKADRELARKAQDALVRKLAKEEGLHAAAQAEGASLLVQAREAAERSIADLRTDYERRLLQSTRRSQVYRDQAEAGATACRNLAGHAAELDRALEEGRGLVGELRETLGLRDRQVILLGKQILEDRKLFEGGPR